MNRDAIAALRELEEPRRETMSPWQVSETFRDPAGAAVSFRREPDCLVMTIGGTDARFGPATLRSIARVLSGAAFDIEHGDDAPPDRPDTFA